MDNWIAFSLMISLSSSFVEDFGGNLGKGKVRTIFWFEYFVFSLILWKNRIGGKLGRKERIEEGKSRNKQAFWWACETVKVCVMSQNWTFLKIINR